MATPTIGTTQVKQPPAKSPIAVTADSRMSEDYILSTDIVLNPQSDRAIAAVKLPGGGWSALAVVANTGLVHVLPDANTHSGWNTTPISNGSAVVEVVTGIDAIGTTHAFYQDGKNTYHMSLGSDGSWSPVDQFAFSQNLGVAYVPLFGEIVAYGITIDGNLLFIRKDANTGTWQGNTCDMKKGLQGGQAILNMTDGQAWTLAAAVSGQFQLFTGSGNDLASGPQVIKTNTSITRIHFVYEHLNSTMTMFSDDKYSLYTSVGFSDDIAQIQNSQVVQGTGILDSSNKIHFYAADPTGKMWVLHQTGWDANNAPVWAHMFPLDVNVATVASPLKGMDGKVLFAAGVDQTFHILTQDASTQRWKRTRLQNPSKLPYHLTRYRTQLTVTDPYGNPARNEAVTITASSETDILSGGKTYLIGPSQSATLTTDATGVVTITRTATSLVTPQYTVTSPNLPTAVTVYPDDQYHSFLAGKSTINTGSAVIPAMSPDTLQNATVNGQPLAPNLSKDNATAASQGIISGMKSVPGSNDAASLGAGWALDFRDAQNGQYRTFTTKDDLQAYLSNLQTPQSGAAALKVGDIWNDIADFFGDIWHAIESAAMAVVNWIVDTVESVINLVVQIGEDLIQLAALAIKTIEDAIPFIHSIFNFIGALVEKVLDWVKDLFGWEDIWNTKKVFEGFILGALPSLESFLTTSAPIKVDGFFGKMKAEVDAELQKVIATLQGKSINSLGPPQASPMRARALQASQTSPSQSNWILSKVKENADSSTIGPLTSNPPHDILTAFWDAVSDPKVVKDFTAALNDLSQFFQLAFTNPKAFATQGASDLVAAVQALVDWALDFLDTLIDKLLAMIAAALDAIKNILTQPLADIPVVSWLYTNVICPSDQQEQLSILHIGCLIAAFPVTLAYKFAHGGTPPYSSAQAEAVYSAALKLRENPGSFSEAAAGLNVGGPSTIQEVYMYLSIIQACNDIASDASSQDAPPGDTGALFSGWLDLAINDVMQVLSWPGQIFSFNWDWDSFTEGQKLSRAAWLVSWVPLLANGVTMVYPSPQEGKPVNADPDEDGGDTSLLFLTSCGALILGLGVAGASKSLSDPTPTNGYDIAAAVFAPLANLSQFLRFQPVVDSSEGVSAVVKLIVDGVGDIGAGVCQANG